MAEALRTSATVLKHPVLCHYLQQDSRGGGDASNPAGQAEGTEADVPALQQQQQQQQQQLESLMMQLLIAFMGIAQVQTIQSPIAEQISQGRRRYYKWVDHLCAQGGCKAISTASLPLLLQYW
jgi:hypothetical protein